MKKYFGLDDWVFVTSMYFPNFYFDQNGLLKNVKNM